MSETLKRELQKSKRDGGPISLHATGKHKWKDIAMNHSIGIKTPYVRIRTDLFCTEQQNGTGAYSRVVKLINAEYE